MATAELSPEAALLEIRGLAKANRFNFEPHALARMEERGAQVRDVQFALCNATECRCQPENGRWKVDGADLDGDALTLVVEIDDGLLVVTVF